MMNASEKQIHLIKNQSIIADMALGFEPETYYQLGIRYILLAYNTRNAN